jgi:hypothetical protein
LKKKAGAALNDGVGLMTNFEKAYELLIEIEGSKDRLWKAHQELLKLSEDEENSKAKDYFSTAAGKIDEAYLSLRTAMWYVGSAKNFTGVKDVRAETSEEKVKK